jgi:diguanylate cyclase (GGDEF)-like protein
VTYQLLHSESERIQALCRYDLLDTGPEAAYDDLTRLAAIVCRAPVALISLVDANRVWYKSRVGMDVPEVPREASFCSHAIAEGVSPFEVLMMDGDPRFPVAPLIGGRPIRFMAGALLRTPDDHALGTISVMDTRSRSLEPDQREALAGLARQVMTHLELRRHTRALADTVRDLREAETTIRYLAYHDALTGLPSRRLCHDRLIQAMARAERFGETLAVMFLDLDGFKAVNDTWGHGVGDRLLEAVAARLKSSLRKSDTVARIGGDEFALICPDIRRMEKDAALIAEKVLEALRQPFQVDGLELAVTGSIGIVLYPHDGATAETLLMDADAAMYRAKRSGRNTFAFSLLANVKNCISEG